MLLIVSYCRKNRWL